MASLAATCRLRKRRASRPRPTALAEAITSRPSGGSTPASVSPWRTPIPATRPRIPNQVRRALRRRECSLSRNVATERIALAPSSDASRTSSSKAGLLSEEPFRSSLHSDARRVRIVARRRDTQVTKARMLRGPGAPTLSANLHASADAPPRTIRVAARFSNAERTTTGSSAATWRPDGPPRRRSVTRHSRNRSRSSGVGTRQLSVFPNHR